MNDEIRIHIKKFDNNKITLEDGREFSYIKRERIIARAGHENLHTDFATRFLLSNYDCIYFYLNKWAYYKRMGITTEWEILSLIEKDKQKERLGNKYKRWRLDKKIGINKFCKIYCDITNACDVSPQNTIEYFMQIGADPRVKYPLSWWIEKSHMTTWPYNFLFVDWFKKRD